MQITNRTVRILILALAAVIVAGGAYGWILTRVWQLRGDIVETANTADARAEEEARARSAERLLETTEEERAKLASYFVTEDTVVQFIETLEALGDSADVSITIASVTIEEDSSEGAAPALRVRFTAASSWQNVMYFTALIDALPFLVEIVGADFERSNTPSSEAWKGAFTVRAMMLP